MSKTAVSVPKHDGTAVSVDAWPLTDSGMAVTRGIGEDSGRYVVTEMASGLRLPVASFRTIKAAREAWSRLLEMVPDAPELARRLGRRELPSTDDVQRFAAGWRKAIGVEPMPSFHAVLADVLPPGWDGDVDTLTCPHGHVIEHDGRCPSGCVSPLIAAGLV